MFGGPRYGAITFAVLSGASAAREVIVKTETTVLNVPLSMLYVAIAGAMFGFFLLGSRDAARMTEQHAACWKKKLVYYVLTAIPLVVFVICYAFIAAWVVQAGVGVTLTLTKLVVHESLILPVTGLVGVGIRPWLPTLLKAVERRAERAIGGDA